MLSTMGSTITGVGAYRPTRVMDNIAIGGLASVEPKCRRHRKNKSDSW